MRFIAIVLLTCLSSPAYAAPPPNIILILADDLGYADLGCYGAKDIKTPNIDKLAQQGVRLTSCYSAAPVCTPTRAALMTGRYPQKFGFDWVIRYTEKERGLPANESVLAPSMKKAGYSTALFGKWHLGYKPEFGPNAHGFDQFLGFLAADLDYWSHNDALGDPGLYENTKLVEQPGYLTDLITQKAQAFIQQNKDRPFFVEVAYNAGHWPFQTPNDPTPRTKDNYGLEHGSRSDYVKMVERMDLGVGEIVAELDRLGLANNTLIVFTNDNGGERLSDNRPFFHGKYSLWEGGIRVPCIMKLPNVLPANQTSSQPVITMDLTATLLRVAGATPSTALDGENVLPILQGKSPEKVRTFCWRLPRPDAKHGQKAIRYGKWKLVHDRECDLLFDVLTDPGERNNVAFHHADIVKGLNDRWDEWNKTLPKPPS